MRPAILVLAGIAGCSTTPPADRVFTNAVIYTADSANPKAEAVAVRAGKIVFVGSAADVKTYEGSHTEVIDLGGNTLTPGFVDSHVHLSGVGQREMILNLEGTRSLDEMVARVKAQVDRAAPGAWVVGLNWIETPWNPRRFPTRQDLDRISPSNPVYLSRADGHAGVANSVALKLAGVTRATKPPAGGDILKDASGEPTGMFIDNAQDLVYARIPPPTTGQQDSMYTLGVERELMLGWTQVQDAGVSWDDVARVRRLYQEGKIKLRIYVAIGGPSPSSDSLLARGPIIGEFDGRYTVRTIKSVMDGALGSRGALLLKPYSDAPTQGLLTLNLERFRPMLREALRKGIQVEVHAIGDSANRLLLNEFEAALNDVPRGEQRKVKDPRWRDEHTQIVDPSDIPRFKKLGIIPSMQPSHAIGDLYFAPSRLGSARLAGAYAWQSFLKDGNLVIGG
ncbi:MAG TPA: amidohydrolase, partial [Gemmatimonadales bacterium]|nr:amidohydrolase [Gemmatimonadales bacterium]